MTQAAPDYLTLILRTSTNPEALGNSLRNAVAGLDPEQPVYRIRTARATVESGLGSISLLGSLLGAFATVGLILAAIGIYGVVSYTVVQRTGELGIRMALGAERTNIFKLILGQGMSLMAIGVAIGLVGAIAAGRVLMSLLYDVGAVDAGAVSIAVFSLLTVALIACCVPARRATRVDPIVALRTE
jgi:putative ABC transport system permease protein